VVRAQRRTEAGDAPACILGGAHGQAWRRPLSDKAARGVAIGDVAIGTNG